MERILKTISSLRLTVILLGLGIILVFIGTVAQADEGLYVAQARYFKHWWIFGVSMFGHKLPLPYPGGYLIGTTLLVNLLAAHYARFKWGWKKSGIFLTHIGVIMLLVGQLSTDIFARETMMRFSEGETRHYSESAMDFELAVISDAGGDTEKVVAIPDSMLKSGAEIKHEQLPFTIKIKDFWENSNAAFRAPMQKNGEPLTTNGVAQRFDFSEKPLTHAMNDKNVPTAVVEIIGPKKDLGNWVLSGWSADKSMLDGIHFSYSRQMGDQLADTIITQLSAPQTVQVEGKEYQLWLRPTRVYQPYSVTLLKTTHTVYPGTDTPKDFRSRVRIDNPLTKEKREVEIYMNNPLRYSGLTFYQSQMGRDEFDAGRGSSTFQVVRNPGWLTPYIGCIVVGLGLVVQFMIHLVGFISKRRSA